MSLIKSVDELRALYRMPGGRSLEKELTHLEKHSRQFISLSPFLVIGSSSGDGTADVSPRGEAPGFVKVLDDKRIAIPDRPGNNRLDTLRNLLEKPQVGLIFLIPGVDETLRINGHAEIRDDDELLEMFAVSGKRPCTVLLVHVEEVYLHCAKALMRSKLWQAEAMNTRDVLPAMGQMISDQIGAATPPETQQDMQERYRKVLY